MPERIFVDAETQKEIRREPMKRGRPPVGSYKDADGNLICPVGTPKQPEKKPEVKEDNGPTLKAPEHVPDKTTGKNTQEIQEAFRMTLDELMDALFICGIHPMEKRGDILIYRSVYIGFKLYLKKYGVNLFNAVVPMMTVDPKNNVINIWGWYGPKKEDEQGNVYYDFDAVSPKYVITGLLRPDEEN